MGNERKLRLIQVAKEFNVGINTITDFLHKKGIKSDGSPNTLVDAETYAVLEKEFGSNRAAASARNSIRERISLKQTTITLEEAKKQEREEEKEVVIKSNVISVKDEIPQMKILGKIDLSPKPKPAPPKPEPVVVAPEPEPIVVAPEPEPEPEPEPVAPDLSPSPQVIAMEKALREEAIASKGKFSEKLLAKYPLYAEAYVRDYVKKRGGTFSPDFEKWLKNTKNNREVFAMFFPPDPSVATNVAFMIDELGLETTEKYNQLVLAFAVGRREFGMGAFDLTQQGRYIDALGKLNGLRSSGVMPPPADLYCAGKPPVNWYGNAPRTVDEECYKKVEAYLDRKKITPKQAWVNKYPTVSEIGDTAITEGNLAGFLHEYLYRHGQLRRKRDPFPTPVEFFTYLVDKYENCSKLRDVDHKRVEWTGVSLEGTPWPAMMALSETRPLRECDSVWERYMGQRGPTRL